MSICESNHSIEKRSDHLETFEFTASESDVVLDNSDSANVYSGEEVLEALTDINYASIFSDNMMNREINVEERQQDINSDSSVNNFVSQGNILTANIASSSTSLLQPPRWIPDNDAPLCMSCAVPFTPFFRRRHHCRNCGGVFCNICSSLCTPLPKYGLYKAVRVCKDCFIHENQNCHNST